MELASIRHIAEYKTTSVNRCKIGVKILRGYKLASKPASRNGEAE